MKWALRITTGLALFAVGCTQGAPTISSTEDLPAITLSQTHFESKNLELFDLPLSGSVSKLVNSLQISFDGGTTWVTLENNSQSSLEIQLSACDSSCPFEYGIQNVGQQFPALNQLPVDGEAQGQLRGSSVYGNTAPTSFFIKKLKRGFVSIGSIGLNRVGGKVKTMASGIKAVAGRLEARVVTRGTVNVGLKSQGVIQ